MLSDNSLSEQRPIHCLKSCSGEGRAGQGRAGQGRAGQGRAGQGSAGPSRWHICMNMSHRLNLLYIRA